MAVATVFVDGPQLNSRQRLAPVADHQLGRERVDAVEPDVVAVLDQRAERGRIADGRLDQREVLGAVVVQDQEAVLTAHDGVFDGVLDQLAPREDRRERRLGIRCVGVQHLGGDRTARRDEQVLVAA
jgi:hypothetical protein